MLSPAPPTRLMLPQLLAAGSLWQPLLVTPGRRPAELGAITLCLPLSMAHGAQVLLSLSVSWKILTVQCFLCPGSEQRVETLTFSIVTETLRYFVLENTEMPV